MEIIKAEEETYMHSRIFQISRKPVSREDYFDEDRYYDDFVGHVADYVVKSSDRNDDIEWLRGYLEGVADFSGDKFRIINRKKYFEDGFQEFCEAADSIREMSLEDYIGSGGSNPELRLYMLNKSYEDKYSFYLDDDEYFDRAVTLDRFMRHVNEDETYYIGQTFDYHC